MQPEKKDSFPHLRKWASNSSSEGPIGAEIADILAYYDKAELERPGVEFIVAKAERIGQLLRPSTDVKNLGKSYLDIAYERLSQPYGPQLEHLLQEYRRQHIRIDEVYKAAGGVVGMRLPTKAELITILEEMSKTVDSRPEAPRRDVVSLEVLHAFALDSLLPPLDSGMAVLSTHAEEAVKALRAGLARDRGTVVRWDGKPDKDGNALPPVNSRVKIHLARSDAWVDHVVTGYSMSPSGVLSVKVMDRAGYPNSRALADIRPTVDEDGVPL